MADKTIYELELHEIIEIYNRESITSLNYQTVTRVPGGWIYRTVLGGQSGKSESSVFVPLNNEFAAKTNDGGVEYEN